jgi:hypothetical protein
MKELLSRQATLLVTWSVVLACLFLPLSYCATPVDVKAQPRKIALSRASTSALQSSGVFTPTHQIHLPVIYNTPPITEILKTKYLFVEHWVHKEYSQDCPWPALTSIPVYSFDPENGVLTIYPPNPDFILQADDIGYIGAGASGSHWFANYLYRFQETPFLVGEMTLHALDNAGFASLEYLGAVITLAPGASWISSTVSQTSTISTCFVTNTDRITNYAFQRRDRIEYYNAP